MTPVYAKAPVRIDFAGGWSDVPTFANQEGGAVVNAAISLYAHVECRMGGGKIRIIAEDLQQRLTAQSASEIRYDGILDLHKAALNMFPVLGGIEMLSRADVPPGSGLGASGALDVALVAALCCCREEVLTDVSTIAEMGYELEATELGLLGGKQDQYAAAIGGFLSLEFARDQVNFRRMNVSPELASLWERSVVLAYTGQSHFSSQTHERVWAGYHEGVPDVIEAISTMRDLADPVSTALEDGDVDEVGRLVDENWKQQQRLDETISTVRAQDIERAAREAGACGAKATGAGAGGCMIFVVQDASRERVIDAVTSAGARHLPFQFVFHGVETSL